MAETTTDGELVVLLDEECNEIGTAPKSREARKNRIGGCAERRRVSGEPAPGRGRREGPSYSRRMYTEHS